MTTGSLASRVVQAVSQIRGAPEHDQIAALIGQAEVYVLDDTVTAALARTIELCPNTLEQNIDLINLRSRVLWIEYPDAPRRRSDAIVRDGARHPVVVGALVCLDEHNEDRLLVVTAWDFDDGSVRHSYAAMAFSRTDLSQLAFAARSYLSKVAEESITRLLDHAYVFIPAGLKEEMDEIALIEGVTDTDAITRSVKLDVLGEAPFILGALLALSSNGLALSQEEGKPCQVNLPPQPRRLPFPLSLLRRDGFIRRKGADFPTVSWRPPV